MHEGVHKAEITMMHGVPAANALLMAAPLIEKRYGNLCPKGLAEGCPKRAQPGNHFGTQMLRKGMVTLDG